MTKKLTPSEIEALLKDVYNKGMEWPSELHNKWTTDNNVMVFSSSPNYSPTQKLNILTVGDVALVASMYIPMPFKTLWNEWDTAVRSLFMNMTTGSWPDKTSNENFIMCTWFRTTEAGTSERHAKVVHMIQGLKKFMRENGYV